jgi:tRNA nucleotidyltransferase (CCA-adding enzyme)
MPDYMYLLESRLSPEQRALLERIQELSRSQDVNVYLTGGAVRDLISGQPIRDLDFTVEGNPVRMVRELEKGGARVVRENERLRHYEMVFAGDADGSLSAARDDYYERPGAKPEVRFAGIMEDLRRRDFSINAIAISLNSQSLGLLLDPTNGLADLEKQEVRALSIHSFTNQPIRIMRILRYCARMGFKMEQRTQEWFDLAIERGHQKRFESSDVGTEVLSLSREETAAGALKLWEEHDLLGSIHPNLQRRKPDYESLQKLVRVRGDLMGAGIRSRLQVPTIYFVLSRLKPREATSAMRAMEFTSAEINAVTNLVPEAQKIVKMLKGRKTNAPRDAVAYIASVPAEMLAFIEVELPNPKILSKLRNYLQKWRPLKQALPANELEALGIPRGPKFDKILDQLFDAQIRGRAKTPEDRTKLLKQFAGIKDEPKKPIEKEKKKKKGRDEHVAALTKPAPGAAAPAATPAPAHASKEPAAAPTQAAAKTAAKASKPTPHTATKPVAASQKSKQKATKKSRR